jgi:hypothetical protein
MKYMTPPQGGGGWEALVVNAIGHLPHHLRATHLRATREEGLLCRRA